MATSNVLYAGEPPNISTMAKELKHKRKMVEAMRKSVCFMAGNST